METSNLHLRPLALKPIYTTEEPSQSLKLYQGSLEITQNGMVKQGNGTVYFEWFPSPDVRFDFSSHDDEAFLMGTDEAEASLKLLDIPTPVSVEVFILKIATLHVFISGSLKEPLILGSGENLSYLLFHLTNFYDFIGSWILGEDAAWTGRVILEAEGWRVTIDSLENLADIKKLLEFRGGYAITHVGKLERSDKGAFTVEAADTFLEGLHYFLSFSRGFWSSLLLRVGYNLNGEKLWEQWTSYNESSWRSVYPWFPKSQPQSLNNAFQGFFRRWQDPIWNEPIRLAIHWYIEGNAKAGGVEGSIVLEQAAFELLSWTLIVEKKCILSSDGFNKLPAADQLRLLLSQCSVPLEIPDSLTNLSELSKELNWQDGAQALTEMRNAIAHSNPKKRQRVLQRPIEARVEAWRLGLWYLELVFLSLFKYTGEYFNCVSEEEYHDKRIQPVPWS